MMVPPAAARWAVRWTAVGAMVVLTGLLLLAVFLLPAGVGVGSASATPGAEGSAAAYGAATSDALDGASVLRKGPYLMYAGDNTRMAVMWQTTTAAPPPTALEWGYTPDYRRSVDEVQEVDTAADGSLFRCDLTGLQPGALVHYRLTVGEESYGGSFRVAPPEEADRATLYAASDTQDNPQAYGGVIAALLADMAAEPGGRQSICLHAGDFVGAGLKEQAWDTEFFSREYPAVGRFLADVPVMGALGNHESYAFQMGSDDPTGAGPLLRAYWPDLFSASPPHFYYSFDYGPVHVAVLDTWTCAFDSGSEQYDWLERDLSASTKAWEIVMLHNPVYAAGSLRDNGALIRQHLQPLLERAGVSLVLAGHHHFYSRCEVGGIQYLTLGGGGGELSKPVLSAPYVVAGASAHHFVRLECRGGALTGTALGVDGAVLDRFVLAPSWSDLPHDALSGYGVTLAQLAGISSGYEDGTFRPDQSIPR
ncbi:MAG: hypothetical protein GXX83_11005, partial [Gaiellales bacterium]|nr:hypothetical protein [Gaiellales bacterium]